jgi:hypothetical protein
VSDGNDKKTWTPRSGILGDLNAAVMADIAQLTRATLNGDISLPDGRSLTDPGPLSEGDVHAFVKELIGYMLENQSLAALMSALGSMTWLTLAEAMLYSRVKDRKTIRKLLDDGIIYGSDALGDWRVERKSIDDALGARKLMLAALERGNRGT